MHFSLYHTQAQLWRAWPDPISRRVVVELRAANAQFPVWGVYSAQNSCRFLTMPENAVRPGLIAVAGGYAWAGDFAYAHNPGCKGLWAYRLGDGLAVLTRPQAVLQRLWLGGLWFRDTLGIFEEDILMDYALQTLQVPDLKVWHTETLGPENPIVPELRQANWCNGMPWETTWTAWGQLLGQSAVPDEWPEMLRKWVKQQGLVPQNMAWIKHGNDVIALIQTETQIELRYLTEEQSVVLWQDKMTTSGPAPVMHDAYGCMGMFWLEGKLLVLEFAT